jgi:hypothetical protein
VPPETLTERVVALLIVTGFGEAVKELMERAGVGVFFVRAWRADDDLMADSAGAVSLMSGRTPKDVTTDPLLTKAGGATRSKTVTIDRTLVNTSLLPSPRINYSEEFHIDRVYHHSSVKGNVHYQNIKDSGPRTGTGRASGVGLAQMQTTGNKEHKAEPLKFPSGRGVS